ncbi:hypothetical protein BACCAP_01875 [Pseudoflavonifractor capillosus ATCC 29799]|uniref:Uncharacterized protein n=1 Tax=Pseudoflavonifractor capillosus ATCC 29799 TaxID=411467 RepID=A6NUJ3_9FIRM|nr:hypothetical protein BACCAP_01875 [Pseudoflavonifractor capillosus ATCC 29799]
MVQAIFEEAFFSTKKICEQISILCIFVNDFWHTSAVVF